MERALAFSLSFLAGLVWIWRDGMGTYTVEFVVSLYIHLTIGAHVVNGQGMCNKGFIWCSRPSTGHAYEMRCMDVLSRFLECGEIFLEVARCAEMVMRRSVKVFNMFFCTGKLLLAPHAGVCKNSSHIAVGWQLYFEPGLSYPNRKSTCEDAGRLISRRNVYSSQMKGFPKSGI